MPNIFDASSIRNTTTFQEGSLHTIIPKDRAQQVKRLRYPQGSLDKTHGWILFQEVQDVAVRDADDNDTLLTRPHLTGNSVRLYLPKEGIQVQDKAQYDNASLGLAGKFIETADIRNINVVQALDGATKSITDAFDVLSNPGEQNKSLITKVIQQAKVITPQNVNAAARSRIKRTANPYLRAIFEQVSRRSFNYSFEMIPNNPQEARTIKEIVAFFRTNLYPDVEGLDNAGTNFTDFVYKFPNKFRIHYDFDGKKIAHKMLDCYLESVSVSFSNQGTQTFHPDGEFLSTKIDLSFTEERTLNRNDVDPSKHDDGVGY